MTLFRKASTIGLETDSTMTKKYADLINHIPGGIGILRFHENAFYLDYANAGWFRIHHIKPSDGLELLGKNVFPFVYEPDQQAVRTRFLQYSQQSEESGSVTYRYQDEAGTIHWIKMRFCHAYTENDIQYYYATVINLDEQKKAEEKLADSQHALQEAVANSGIQFFTYFPEKHLCEIFMTSNHLKNLPLIWPHFPEDFLSYTQANDESQQAYRSMLEKIDSGADEAECTVHFAYQGMWNWEKMHLKAVRDAGGKDRKSVV